MRRKANSRRGAMYTLKEAMNIVQSKRTVPNRRKALKNNGMASTNPTGKQITTEIPLMIATTTYQSAKRNLVHREMFDEIIGSYTIGPNTPRGEVVGFQLDPTALPASTRFATMATLYSQYKVLSGQFRVGYNLSTATTGNAIHGFSKNPDYDINEGDFTAVYSLFGGQDSRFYTPCNVPIETDTSKWLNVDEDSDERMMCSAGVFYIMVMTPPSTTAAVTVPVFFRGVVEFKSPARQKPTANTSLVVFPSCTITSTNPPSTSNGPVGACAFAPIAGEPGIPTLDTNAIYLIIPSVLINVSATADPEFLTARYLRRFPVSIASSGFVFYTDERSAVEGVAIPARLSSGDPSNNTFGRFVLQSN